MKLGGSAKLSIKQQYRIRFVLPNGMECVITEHGIAQVPALKSVPDFNLEQELASVGEFLLEPPWCPTRRTRPNRAPWDAKNSPP